MFLNNKEADKGNINKENEGLFEDGKIGGRETN